MRKKKTEIAPAPVETDFYTEALKAFDVVLPPTQEELEIMRQAEEEKARLLEAVAASGKSIDEILEMLK